LFVGECGRTDLAGGNSGDLYDSLVEKILPLDDTIEVYPGHDYGKTTSSTIGFERRNNYTLKRRTREEFIKFMAEP
jgi:glyoxylase-like metal-dependent hydrolase (beta-lactamase superfamily II)